MVLSKEFEDAKKSLDLAKNDPGNEVKLKLYGLFKQASVGDCNTPKPGFTDLVNKYKWNAWSSLKSMSASEAEKSYVSLVEEILNKEGITLKKSQTKEFAKGIETSIVFGNVYKITLNRPDKLNSITSQMFIDIPMALAEADNNPNVVLILITGTGKYFSSGNDLGNYLRPSDDFEADIIKGTKSFENFTNGFINLRKPLIGLINGPAIGAAFTILALFDMVIASDEATFHAPFTGISLSPEGCSSFTFPRLMGQVKASEILLFNRKLTAQEAMERNLVTEILAHSGFEERALERVEQFSRLNAASLQIGKELLRRNDREKLLQVNRSEMEALVSRLKSGDFMESVMTFVNKKAKI